MKAPFSSARATELAADIGAPVEERGAQARFGTFGGVFTPCTLTILGVIMFMRSGYVVGERGLFQAIIILAIAKVITSLTTFSLSAIATNTEIRTGGVYYMISRTLGADFGGTIGLTLFVSQAISIAFYVIGFTEALVGLLPGAWTAYPATQLISSGILVLLFGVTFKGADVAIKTQYFILAVLLAAVVSFVVGGVLNFDPDHLVGNRGVRVDGADGFWVVFAIFFPAATGITAGANMSGDLKDPGRSIPRGTLAAIGFTAAIYLTQLVLMAGFSEQAGLSEAPFGSLKAMSIFAPAIIAGVFAATLSSALGSFLGAPRILQAMGKDRLLRPLNFFSVGHGEEDEPRRATVLSMMIAVGVVWLGDLNAVARIISMFFLIAYGMINLSAFVEGRGGNPSFRPRFKVFGPTAAIIGTIACAIAMVKLDETAAIIAMLIAAAIYFWLRGRTVGEFRDAKRGFVFKRTRENLLLLEKSPPDPKNWRPAMVVLTDDSDRDRQMIACASWVECGRGLLSILEVVEAPELDTAGRIERRAERIASVRDQIDSKKIVAFPDCVVVDDAAERLDIVLQSYSIGSLRPNTIMVTVPPPSQEERRKRLGRMLKAITPFNVNIVLYKGARVDGLGKKRIDLWWHGQQNGSLMALFSYLMNTHSEWSKARIRMIRVVESGSEHLEAEHALNRLMQAARLEVDIEVILSQRPVSQLIAERSGSADLVLLGMAEKDLYNFDRFIEGRDELLSKLPPTLLVWSNGEVDLMA